uniref:Trefoil factor 2 n=1 Tax=Camelus bactrianus TaxID=9837 RepID=A0A9W3FG49_CAMBA|nr:trefoil factor 2-like [Camelus bactrianus]
MEPKVICVLVMALALALGSLAQSEGETCQVHPNSRSNCGYSGITATDCEKKGCCFDNKVMGVPWCFYPEPVGDPTDDPCQCSRISPANRENCGFPGISSDQCFTRGCCFNSDVPGVPWCFEPLPKQELEECVMEVSARKDCGFPGISPENCTARECCFSDAIRDVPWCFFPLSVEDCHY